MRGACTDYKEPARICLDYDVLEPGVKSFPTALGRTLLSLRLSLFEVDTACFFQIDTELAGGVCTLPSRNLIPTLVPYHVRSFAHVTTVMEPTSQYLTPVQTSLKVRGPATAISTGSW